MRPDPTDAAYHAALAPRTRRRVLDAVVQSGHPIDALTIANALDLHITTVRFHLDQLEAAKLVQRAHGAEKRRGRPRIRYVALRPEDSREQLIDVLAGALSQRDDGGRARSVEAGRRWAEELAPTAASDGPGEGDGVDGVVTLVEVLDDLGFDPVPVDASTIELRACPFRAAARDHPDVVCSVHRGLVEEIMEHRSPDRDPKLLPFVQPELCVITLARS
ncbi:MAG TPA: helix-turn-helix domain-containing protein [Agromyces sp.]|jgi:predicted ArsR family transcriptional regulator